MSKTNMQKFIAGSVTAAVVASAVAPAASAAEAKSFTDVSADHWAYDAITSLVNAGVINGYPDNTFRPGLTLNRGQAANLLTKALDLPIPTDLKAFSDVSEKSAFAEGAAATKAAGIFGGSNGKFGAADQLTREQMATVIVRAFDLKDTGKEVSFTDEAKISASHRENVKILAQNGITTGKADGSFDPKGTVSRAHFAAFLQRAVEGQTPVVKEIASIGTVADITVKEGEKVELPKTVEVTYKDDSKEQVAVTWEEKDFSKAGEYKVTGTVEGTDLKAEVKVTVVAKKVVSVDSITKTGVSFKIKATDEAVEGFTVLVLDNTGKEVEVNPVNLVKGETEVTLTFKTALTVDPVGVWSVDGVQFDLDAIKNYSDIVSASASNNEVATLAALKKAGIANIKEGNITNYVSAINASTTKEKLADIQAIVDKTNETGVTAEEAAAAVKAVNEATNQVQLLSALQNKAFARVNAEWIVAYNNAITAAKATPANTDTVAEIQALVDGENTTAIGNANTAADTVAKQNVVTELIKNYTADDVAPATTKADAVKASEVKSAVFGVKEATTAAAVYNALVKLSALDSTNLPAASLNANLKAEYLTAKNGYNFGTLTTAAVKTNIVDAADASALSAALTTIDGLTNTNTVAEIKAALQKLADVTAHETGTDKFDMSTVKDANLSKYVTLATDGFADATINSIALVNTAIATVELNTVLDIVNNTSSTSAEVSAALLNLAVVRTGDVGAKTNAEGFISLSPQARLEVAQLVIDNRSTGYANLDALIATANGAGAVKTQQDAHAALVAKFNAIGDLSAATTAGTKANLDTFAYAPYVALTGVQKVAVAEEINKLTKLAGNPAVATSLDFSGTDAVTTLAQANAYIDAAISKVK